MQMKEKMPMTQDADVVIPKIDVSHQANIEDTSDEVGRGFVEKTSAAIIVLLVFMLLMNGIAIYLRNRFEQRW